MGWRWLNNLGLTFTSLIFVRQVRLKVPVTAAWLASSSDLGLLHIVEEGVVPKLIATFLVLDLSTYVYHRISHKVPLLWRLHVVHHSDTEFDLTTTYRHHPINVAIALATPLPAIIFLGARDFL